MKKVTLLLLLLGLLSLPASANTVQLITNGDFETGDLTGWDFATFGPFPPLVSSGTATPLLGLPTVGPAGGTYYAVHDQYPFSVQALYQGFTVPLGASQVILSFDMFVNNWDGGPFCPGPLDPINVGFNQCARVDLLTAGGLADPLSVVNNMVANFYTGADPPLSPLPVHPYTNYLLDITGLVSGGQTYMLRFANVQNLFPLTLGVDNVSVEATTQAPIPEPASLLLLGTGLLGLRSRLRPRKK